MQPRWQRYRGGLPHVGERVDHRAVGARRLADAGAAGTVRCLVDDEPDVARVDGAEVFVQQRLGIFRLLHNRHPVGLVRQHGVEVEIERGMDSVEVGLVAAVEAVLPGAGVVVLELVGAQPLLRRVIRVVGMPVARVVAGVCSQQPAAVRSRQLSQPKPTVAALTERHRGDPVGVEQVDREPVMALLVRRDPAALIRELAVDCLSRATGCALVRAADLAHLDGEQPSR